MSRARRGASQRACCTRRGRRRELGDERFAADLERSLSDGLILHTSSRTDEGFRIIEFWESKEAWHRFAEEADHVVDGRLSAAVRYRRELTPTHLVLGRAAMNSEPETDAASVARDGIVNLDPQAEEVQR